MHQDDFLFTQYHKKSSNLGDIVRICSSVHKPCQAPVSSDVTDTWRPENIKADTSWIEAIVLPK